MSDLMKIPTASYKELSEKYDSFRTHAASVKIGDTVYKTITAGSDGGAYVKRIEAELHRNEPSMVRITLGNVYDREQSSFSDAVSLGDVCKVEIGYLSSLFPIFTGYVGEMGFEFSSEPEITFRAFDAMTLMSQSFRSRYYSGMKCSDIVKELISPYRKILSADSFDDSDETELPVISVHGKSDAEYIKEVLCPRVNKEFFIFNGKAGFMPISSREQTPTVELKLGVSLFDLRVMCAYGNITTSVMGLSDRDRESAVTEEASGKADGGQSSVTSEGQRILVSDMKLSDNASAKNHAAHLLNERIISLQSAEGRCAGLAEIIPGRCVKLGGIMKKYDDKLFWVDSVFHTLGKNGFTTSFTVKGWS